VKKLALIWLVAGPAFAQVNVQEYAVPRGHRVHDVWADAAPGGPVWISAQGSGNLGILDPKSGKIEFVPLGRGSSPHGVIAAADGAPWLTDGGQNAIVRVDPKTRAVRVWRLPEGSAYANLNTAIFDAKGVHWFTGQSGIYGRLDLKSGEMKVFDAPKGRGPYGIHATPDGTVYYASLAGSFIGKINPDGSTTVIEPPTARQGARRVWSDSKGNVWVSYWNTGQVARYEPATGAWREWTLPGRAHTYAVWVDADDNVWLSDWSANAIVRFDPRSERFTAFPSDRAHANVRELQGRAGEAWGAESGTDRLVRIAPR
jgi:virginiamycin B lyase